MCSDLKLFLVPFVGFRAYIMNFKCKDTHRSSVSSCYLRKGTECNTVHIVLTIVPGSCCLYIPRALSSETASINIFYMAVLCYKLCHPPEGRDTIYYSNVTQVEARKEAEQERQRNVGDRGKEQKGRRVEYGNSDSIAL